MERIEQYYNNTYPALELYLDDLRIVYDTLAALYSQVIIKSNTFKYQDWEDFRLNYKNEPGLIFMVQKDINNLKYDVSVEFSSHNVVINSEGTNPTDIAHSYIQIDKLFQKRITRQYGIYLMVIAASLLFILVVITLILPFTSFTKTTIENNQLIVTTFVSLILAISFTISKPRTKLNLYNKADRKNIFERTKDDIFSNVVASVITTLLGIIIGYLIGHKVG